MALAPLSVCRAQNLVDSLASGLDSSGLAARYNAVTGLENLPNDQIPASVRARLIALLGAEGAFLLHNGTPPTSTDTTDAGELYPEYLSDLTELVLGFRDPASLRALCLTGLQVSGAVQQFVVDHAGAALPFLREAWQNPVFHQGVLETWGRILGSPGAPITEEQRDTVIAAVMAAAQTDPLGFLWAAKLSHMAVLAPATGQMAATAGDAVTRARAAAVESSLGEMRDTLTSEQVLSQTHTWFASICAGSAGARHGACQSIGNFLAHAQERLNHPGNAARVQLQNAIDHATAARDSGLFSLAEAAVIIGNATLVLSRL